MLLLDVVQQRLDVLAGEDRGGRRADHLGEVRRDDGGRVDHGVAEHLGPLLLVRRDPDGRQPEGGLHGRDAVDLLLGEARVHRHQPVRANLAGGHLDAAQLDDVAVRVDLGVVADPDGRQDDAQLQRHLAADHRHPAQQGAVLLGVGQRDQHVADLDLHRVHAQELADVLGLVGGGGRLLELLACSAASASWTVFEARRCIA